MFIHFMGVGGSGMSGVARLAEKMGYTVTGCDLEERTAYAKSIFVGHSPDHLKGVDLLIVSPAILYQNSKNAELVEAQKRKIVMTWEEFLGKILLKNKKMICIAGTHGKSTTTAMTGKMLIDAGLDPIIVVGAYVPEWGGNSRYGKGEYALVEADEFNNNFLNYHPEIAVINNVEFDHPDFFKNEKEVKDSFDKFIKNLVGQKLLITEKDSLGKRFDLKIFGEHNQKNANMVFLLGKALGISEEKIIKSIEGFTGIGRRMELIADRNGIKVYDDYAHHPTAIKATLEGVREKYPEAKILVIDEPHGYKRTKALLSEYKGVFDSADKVIIGPIFQARDEVDKTITPQKVAEASGHKDAVGVKSFEEIISNFEFIISNFDVIVVMGAGKSFLWAREIAKFIEPKFSDITSLRIGGKIKKYFEVKNETEISDAIRYAKENNLPIFMIGGGTDFLASDKEFNGVVIKYIGDNVSLKDDEVTAEGGLSWDKLVEYSVKNNLQGIECLSGIPGTVGASPIQNIGAYGQELADTFVELTAYDIEKQKFVRFNKTDCKFGYRESVFKQKSHWQKYVIVSVTLKLHKDAASTANYESLKGHIKNNPTLMDVRNAILEVRNEKLENPMKVGNAGSFFKNPIVDVRQKEKLEKKFPGIKIFPFDDKFKVSAAWLIETAGWKGKSYKDAGVSPKHALILINKSGNAGAQDILKLSEMITDDVYKKFGVKLEREVQLINF
jgi:UDP-N-acetylenolpyruvoylglucosamine reductase